MQITGAGTGLLRPAAKEVLVMEEGDRSECERIMRSRKTAVSKAWRARMLVLAARGLSNRQIALELGASAHVVGRVRSDLPRLHRKHLIRFGGSNIENSTVEGVSPANLHGSLCAREAL
jgi:hypothetical protein